MGQKGPVEIEERLCQYAEAMQKLEEAACAFLEAHAGGKDTTTAAEMIGEATRKSRRVESALRKKGVVLL